MSKKFKIKQKDNFGDKILRSIARIFKRKPLIVNLNEPDLSEGTLPPKCFLIGNHNGAGGPFNFRTFLKKRFMSWGAHPMCEGFNSRRRYLYHIFYRQKLGYGKFKAFIMSILFGAFSRLAYGYAGIIPIYYDSRLFLTYRYSFMCLDKDISVLVFPEDSNEGYKERIEKFLPGFLHLSRMYTKQYGEELPIYTMYYKKKPQTIIIGKPLRLSEIEATNDEEIMQVFMDYMNSLNDIDISKLINNVKDKKEEIL